MNAIPAKSRVLLNLLTTVCLCIGLALGWVSCSSRTVRTESLSHEFLFPLGTYKHSVKIRTIQDRPKDSKEFSFNGVVQIGRKWIKITVLSPFGTTLVKVQEDRVTGKVDFVSYLESFKKYESKFQDYYSVLKLLLIAPENPSLKDNLRIVRKDKYGMLEEVETQGLEQKAVLLFKKYDENRIPEEIQIRHPRFVVDIRVSGYDV